MDANFDPGMTPEERAASLAAFDLRWPFPDDFWRLGRMEIHPDRVSYDAARSAVAAGHRVVSIAGSVTMEVQGAQRTGEGKLTLLLRPDSFAPRQRWVNGPGTMGVLS